MVNNVSQSPRPNSSSSSSSPSSTSVNTPTFSYYAIKNFTIKHLLNFLILLPLSFILLTLFLQWRGGDGSDDQLTRLSTDRRPVTCTSPASAHQLTNSSSADQLSNAKRMGQKKPFFDFSHIGGWNFNYNESVIRPKVCITSTTSAGLEDIIPWIFYHKVVGVTNFFLFVEGKAASPNVSNVLESIPGVKTVPRTRELEEQQANSHIWNETWLAGAFYKPCNHALFVKQTLNMEMAIVMAREAGMEWILHLDTDELLHPGGTPDYSVGELLANVPTDVDTVVFLNYEAAVERDDVKDPFSEVSLFKRNTVLLPTNNSEFEFYIYKEAMRPGNPSYFLTYANGKSAARIQDHLRPNGAHRWYNYMKEPTEMQIDEAVVLHYTYTRFSDLISRRDRCNCKPTQEDVKRCFYLRFDRNAFIIASTRSREEMLQWYQERVVWSDEAMKLRLLKYGILTRIYTPMVIIQQLKASEMYASMITSTHATSSNPEISEKNVDANQKVHIEGDDDDDSQESPVLSSPGINNVSNDPEN